mmetsp:Transcript_16614/g.36343  ORF Transcript_16614/g.36343 Transcript_16614/m.36343 type:complete len:744 (+) Transcript_16614:137-2368(+)
MVGGPSKPRSYAQRHFNSVRGAKGTLSTSELHYDDGDHYDGPPPSNVSFTKKKKSREDDYQVDRNDLNNFEIDDQQGVEMSHSLPVPEQVKTDAAIHDQQLSQEDESRTAFKKNRRISMILFATAVLAFIAVIAFLVAFLTRGRSGSSRANPLAGKAPDVNPLIWDSVYGLIETYTPHHKLDTPDSPQARAANFMARQVQDAKIEVPITRDYADAFEFVQEYVLATLYYSTDGPNWKSQLRFMDKELGDDVCQWNIKPGDAEANGVFVELVTSSKFHEKVVVAGELSAGPNGHVIAGGVDSVLGVQCNDAGEITSLLMPDNNLKGDLPPELGLLEALEHVSLYKNKLTGSIPEGFQYLNDLVTFVVEDNEMTGSIPEYVNEQWTNLELLSLAYNNFSGELPSFLGMEKLTQVALNHNSFSGEVNVFDSTPLLEVLLLNNNQFDGSFYHELLETIPVNMLDVSHNKLTGKIPADFYDVEVFSAHNNLFTGHVPPILWDDYEYKIRFLSLHSNPNMEGQIPHNIGQLTNLAKLDLGGIGLTGDIPASLNHLAKLEYLFLNDNDFDDTQDFPYLADAGKLKELSLRNCNIADSIPHWLGEWDTNLVYLDLSHNALTGDIPTNLHNLEELRFLLLSHNLLDGPVPDSLKTLENLNMVTVDHNEGMASTSVGNICDDDGPSDLEFLLADCAVTCPCCERCCKPNDDACGEQASPNINEGYHRFGYEFAEDLKFEILPGDAAGQQDSSN